MNGNIRNNMDGFYGEDGEFYPSGSQAAELMRKKSMASQSFDNEELYPKRPNIKYTANAYPSAQSPAEAAEKDLSGYTGAMKYCKFCGKKIPEQAVLCVHCGCQVENVNGAAAPAQNIYINSSSNNYIPNTHMKNKWIAFFLCLFGGTLGLHRFYEGKIPSAILYLCTGGLCGVGWFVDTIRLLFKPNPYNP